MFHQFCHSELHLRHWFPAKTPAIVSFVAYCFQQGYAASSITTSLSAISYVHKIHNCVDPAASFVVRKLLHGTQKLRSAIDQRAPIIKVILHKLVRSTSHVASCYYHNILLSAMYLLAFHAFLRIGELAVASTAHCDTVLQVSQLELTSHDFTVVFYSYKHYHGPPVTLAISAHPNSAFCPVMTMRSYLTLRGKSQGPLFIFPGGAPVTKSFFNSQLRKSLAWAGLPTLSYKGHSFSIGAATTAAMQGVSDEEIQRMGRWKSQAFRKYIRIPMFHLQ